MSTQVSCSECGGPIDFRRVGCGGVVPRSPDPNVYHGLVCVKCWHWLQLCNRAEERQPYSDTLVVMPNGG